jgi:hypothetical protein
MGYSQEIINQAKKLRSKGCSYPEISKLCKISKTTALRHCRGVKILPELFSRWKERQDTSSFRSFKRWDEAAKKAFELVPVIDTSHKALIVASLYWAEGAKRDLSFSNTDPMMIKNFVNLLVELFGVKREDLKVSIRVYDDLDVKKCVQFWSDILKIRLFGKVSINKIIGKKEGKLKYGMCRIRIRRGDLIHKNLLSIVKRMDTLINQPS